MSKIDSRRRTRQKSEESHPKIRAKRTSLTAEWPYRGTLLIRSSKPLGPCSRSMPRALWRSWGGGGSYERGTHFQGHHRHPRVTLWPYLGMRAYRGTSLIRNTSPVGPYGSPMPRDLW